MCAGFAALPPLAEVLSMAKRNPKSHSHHTYHIPDYPLSRSVFPLAVFGPQFAFQAVLSNQFGQLRPALSHLYAHGPRPSGQLLLERYRISPR